MPRTSAKRAEDSTASTDLHPSFQTQLSAFTEALTANKLQVEAAVDEYDETVRQIGSFLDFEIDRLNLNIDKMEWAAKASPSEIDSKRARRNLMVAARKMIDEKLTGTQEAMAAFIDILDRISRPEGGKEP